jgi:hypothetical protein
MRVRDATFGHRGCRRRRARQLSDGLASAPARRPRHPVHGDRRRDPGLPVPAAAPAGRTAPRDPPRRGRSAPPRSSPGRSVARDRSRGRPAGDRRVPPVTARSFPREGVGPGGRGRRGRRARVVAVGAVALLTRRLLVRVLRSDRRGLRGQSLRPDAARSLGRHAVELRRLAVGQHPGVLRARVDVPLGRSGEDPPEADRRRAGVPVHLDRGEPFDVRRDRLGRPPGLAAADRLRAGGVRRQPCGPVPLGGEWTQRPPRGTRDRERLRVASLEARSGGGCHPYARGAHQGDRALAAHHAAGLVRGTPSA